MHKFNLLGDKYVVTVGDDGVITEILYEGRPWLAYDWNGASNLENAMAARIQDLQRRMDTLTKVLESSVDYITEPSTRDLVVDTIHEQNELEL